MQLATRVRISRILYGLLGKNTFKFYRNWRLVKDCKVLSQQIYMSSASATEYNRISRYETKEPETLQWIDRFFGSDSILYDIGANIGNYCLYAGAKTLSNNDESKRSKGTTIEKCRVFAFEPQALNIESLNYNIYLNEFPVLAYGLAVGARDELSVLFCDNYMPGRATNSLDSELSLVNQPDFIHGSVTVKLDSLWQSFGLPKPTMIKVDVDGFERKVIEGGLETLKSTELKTILVELTLKEDPEGFVFRTITSYGFRDVSSEFNYRQPIYSFEQAPENHRQNYIFARD